MTSNNCHVSLLLTKVQFLLKDAWSFNCQGDSGQQVFVFSARGKKEQEQFRERVLSSLLLPPGMKQQFWLEEEMNHYFPFVIRQRMLTHSPLTDKPVMAGQRGGLGTLPFHGATQQRATLGFPSGREPLN